MSSRANPEAGMPAAMATAGADPNEPPMGDVEDAVLARAVVDGQIWAQRELWYRFAPMVFGLLRRMLSSQHDPDDLAQEVFLRVFRKMHTLEKQEALRSFVYSVALRVISEEIRRFRVRVRTSTQYQDTLTTLDASPQDFESREALVRIQKILNRMSGKHRAVFILRHVEGLDLQEIAVCLDISLATVKRYLVKALDTIHKVVNREAGPILPPRRMRAMDIPRGEP